MERIVMITENELVDMVGRVLEETVTEIVAEVDSLEEMVKAQDADTERLLETIESQEEEIDAMTQYICKLEKALIESEIKVALYETCIGR